MKKRLLLFKPIYYITFALLICSCASKKESKHMDVIVYTDFVNPQKTYDALANNFEVSGLVDSLKIIGRPIQTTSLIIAIDTLAVNHHNISLNTVEKKIKEIQQLKTVNAITEQFIINRLDQKIPVSEISKISFTPQYYKPKLFIPEPEFYYHNDKRVTKIEFYYPHKKQKQLIDFIHNYIPKTPPGIVNNQWQFEIME